MNGRGASAAVWITTPFNPAAKARAAASDPGLASTTTAFSRGSTYQPGTPLGTARPSNVDFTASSLDSEWATTRAAAPLARTFAAAAESVTATVSAPLSSHAPA